VSAAVSASPDERESELRATLIRLAVARKWVALHFTRDGVAGVAIGRLSSIDSRGVRCVHGRGDELYTVPFSALTRVEALEDNIPPPPRREGER
jgi:hypothetical protein